MTRPHRRHNTRRLTTVFQPTDQLAQLLTQVRGRTGFVLDKLVHQLVQLRLVRFGQLRIPRGGQGRQIRHQIVTHLREHRPLQTAVVLKQPRRDLPQLPRVGTLRLGQFGRQDIPLEIVSPPLRVVGGTAAERFPQPLDGLLQRPLRPRRVVARQRLELRLGVPHELDQGRCGERRGGRLCFPLSG
jgi:hypothetical protein